MEGAAFFLGVFVGGFIVVAVFLLPQGYARNVCAREHNVYACVTVVTHVPAKAVQP